MREYKGIGVMSGTSLDGLDIAYCSFKQGVDNTWSFEIIQAETEEYTQEWIKKLSNLDLSALDLVKLNVEYGDYLGKRIKAFITKYKITPDFVASHGHTLYHQPDKKITHQIGSGNEIYQHIDIPVIYDFRTLDVALGGQGAPLVPVGDLHLFSEYEYCLNLGGIANITDKTTETIVARDICPCNMVLNHVANQLGQPYDESGKLASSGNSIESLLKQLNALDFYKEQAPKSLGKEWVNECILPLLEIEKNSPQDVLATFCEHIAIQISKVINNKTSLLVTGGGAYNDYLISRIKHHAKSVEVKLPEDQIIQFKEAMIFAFLGLLRLHNIDNCLASVTGSQRNSSSGIIIGV